MTKTVVLVAAAHAETMVEVVAEAEADVGENRDTRSGIDGECIDNVSIGGGGGGDGGWQWRRMPKQGQW